MLSPINILIISLFIFQLFYSFESILLLIRRKNKSQKLNNKLRDNKTLLKLSVIIPVLNEEKTIVKCLKFLFGENITFIDRVVIVLDHCTDNSFHIINKFIAQLKKRKEIPPLKIISLKNQERGKTAAIKEATKYIKNKNILLLDADIVLEKEALKKLINFHFQKRNFCSSCLIYPYLDNKKETFYTSVIYNDRLYRQNILQMIRNIYGMANFPGGLGIFNLENYKKIVSGGFLEDLKTTYKILASPIKKVAILPEVLAYEIERETLKGLFFQRVRWTIGNIENFYLFLKAFFGINSCFKKFILISYPVMWYLQHYFIAVLLLTTYFLKSPVMGLLPFGGYFLQIIFSNILALKLTNRKWNMGQILKHSIIFPIIVSIALPFAIFDILFHKGLYFQKELYFLRD